MQACMCALGLLESLWTIKDMWINVIKGCLWQISIYDNSTALWGTKTHH